MQFGLTLGLTYLCGCATGIRVQRSTGHTHTPTENNTPDTDTHTHTHDKNNTPNPQTNTSHKHLTTLEGGPSVRATPIQYLGLGGLTRGSLRRPDAPSTQGCSCVGHLNLNFTIYCFISKLYCGSLSSFYCPPPTRNAYPVAILLHDHCAMYGSPPTLTFYAIHHTPLVMAISCKGQVSLKGGTQICPRSSWRTPHT